MYCSTCGNLINTGLNYCNRCGAKVDKIALVGNRKAGAQEYLAMATGFVGLGGLGLTIGLIAILLNNNVIPPVIVMLTLAFLLTVFSISFMMIHQISKMTKSAASERPLEKGDRAQMHSIVNTAQLEEYRQPVSSVIENTTRTLDKVER